MTSRATHWHLTRERAVPLVLSFCLVWAAQAGAAPVPQARLQSPVPALDRETADLPVLEPSKEALGIAATVREATTPAWWTGYRETPLEQLLALSSRGASQPSQSRQADLVRAYLTLRVQNTRLINAVELWRATQQEREFFAAQAPTRTAAEALQANARRSAAAKELAAGLADQRDAAIRRLLQLAGQGEAAEAAIRAALETTDFPQFHQAVPQRLPASVLLSREDVAQMGRHSAGRTHVAMLLSGWIGPAAQPAPLQMTPIAQQAAAPSEDTLRQAGQEVAWSLRVLLESQSQAATQAQRVEARRLDLMALERRVQAGDAESPQLMLAYQQLLAEADGLAQARGQLALAWAELHVMAPGSMQALAAP